MDITLGEKIRNQRNALDYTLRRLSDECGIDISTLSKIENGTYKGVKEENLVVIARALHTTVEELREGTGMFRTGVGACSWAACLLYMIAEDKMPEKLSIGYYERENEDNKKMIRFLSSDGTSIDLKKPNQNDEFLTAPELIEKLLNNEFDTVFVPSQTYDDQPDITRIASIVNTTKGGVELLVVSKLPSETSRTELIKSVQDSPTLFIYLKDTIAEKQISHTFTDCENADFEFLSMDKREKFLNSIIGKINTYNDDYQYVNIVFAGWNPHISWIKKELNTQKTASTILPLYEFTKPNEGFLGVQFDCIIKSDKKDLSKNNQILMELFKSIRTVIAKIEQLKRLNSRHPMLKTICELQLVTDPSLQKEIFEELRTINFELQFYPEWVL